MSNRTIEEFSILAETAKNLYRLIMETEQACIYASKQLYV